jgi:hypothetical protein
VSIWALGFLVPTNALILKSNIIPKYDQFHLKAKKKVVRPWGKKHYKMSIKALEF